MAQSNYTQEELDRYEDCDRCGERYWGRYRDRLANVTHGREVLRVCCGEVVA